MAELMRRPGMRLVGHLAIAVAVWALLTVVNNNVDPLMNYYIALAAMYATAMFGMVILVGMSGQVSLGNGALMAIGAYSFALTSLNWKTVPLLGVPMNGWWAMVFAAIGGVLFGLLVGGLAARLKGPYLAGLTLGLAVGIPAIATRFPEVFGGEDGLMLTVPYPDGGYEPVVDASSPTFTDTLPDTQVGASPFASASSGDLLTLDNFPSGSASPMPSASSGDLLTLDNYPSGSASPMPSASPFPADGSTDPGSTDVSGDHGFVIEHWQASLAVLVMCIALFVALNLVRGRQGRRWRAVRDDPVAAAVSGIWPAGAKVSAFVFSSFFAALAGGVFAQILSYVGPGAFGLSLSLSLLVGVVLGGRSSLVGAMIGAVLLVWLPELVASLSDERGWSEQVTNNMPNLLYGLLVVLVVLAVPGGIVGSVQAGVARARRRASSRP
ncbi:MAG: branched-chain amino acid ABC transporter permease [Candidatus Nanopelagicales bacterium]